MAKCQGLHRTTKGNRLLTLLATDRKDPEIADTVLHMRQVVPEYAVLTDEQVMDRLEGLIAKIPQKCPDCDGSSD
jgi:hypothetical protein